MKTATIDRCWLLLAGCLLGACACQAIPASSFDRSTAVSAIAVIFFLLYGARRFLPEGNATLNCTTNDRLNHGESELRGVLNGLETQVCVLDQRGVIKQTNQAWDDFARLAADGTTGFAGGLFVDFCRSAHAYAGEGAGQLSHSVASIASEGGMQTISTDYVMHLSGKAKTFRITVQALAGGRDILVTQHDLTEAIGSEQHLLLEKQRAETLANALETSQSSLELAMKGGEIGLWHWDVATGYFELTNADWLDRLGCSNGSLNADVEAFRQLIHPDELVFWTADDAASLSPEEPYDRQFRLRLPSGEYQWVQVLGRSNATNPDGSPESLSGILIDINARKNAELRDAGMAKIIENSINEIYIVDQQTYRFLEVNRGGRENINYSSEELLGMTPLDINPDYDTTSFAELVQPLAEGSAKKLDFETTHRRRDGTTYPIVISLQNGRLLDRDVYVAIGVDLTEARRLESQLAEARRLESIGQLAAGIAHEMNTPLQFVGNNISFLSGCSDALFDVIDLCEGLLDDTSDPLPREERRQAVLDAMETTHFDRIRTEAPKAISESLEGIDRVLQIVRAMKDFTHIGDEDKVPTDLNRAINSTATVTRNRWKESAQLDLDLEAGLPHVTCHGHGINQVLVNLIVNAADAIADRAEKESDAPAGRITIRSRSIDDCVQIEVEDNGGGMTEEVQRRVFDPFFTTKEVGKGTGQGLSLSHTIVTQKHSGSLSAHSTPGEGTVMRVTLPIEPPRQTPPADDPEDSTAQALA